MFCGFKTRQYVFIYLIKSMYLNIIKLEWWGCFCYNLIKGRRENKKRSSGKFELSVKSVASKLHTKGDSRWKRFLK